MVEISQGTRCSICYHADRLEIEKAILSGESYRRVAKRFGVTDSAIGRHVRNGHITKQVEKMAKKKKDKEIKALAAIVEEKEELELTASETITSQVSLLKTRAYAILDRAEHEGTKEACQALSEVRKTLEFLARITGELDTKPDVTINIVNLLQSPEFKQVLVILDEELPQEYRERIATRLYSLGA